MSYELVITVNDVDFRVVFDATPLVPGIHVANGFQEVKREWIWCQFQRLSQD